MLKMLGSRSCLTALTLCAFVALPAFAAKPGKGGGGGPTLPPVRYQVQFWTVPGATEISHIHDTNNSGQTVADARFDLDGDGQFDVVHGCYYDPNQNAEYAVDLNTIVANIPDGWVIRMAKTINEVGQIAVLIAPEPAPTPLAFLQSGMVDMNQNPPVLYLIPDGSFTTYSVSGDINDWGDMVVRYKRANGSFGHYIYNFDPAFGFTEPLDLGITTSIASDPQINNNRVIVGSLGDGDAYRRTWAGGLQTFPGVTPRSINQGGAFSGPAVVALKGKKTTNYAYLCDASVQLFTDFSNANDLNDSKDFIGYWKLRHATYGTLTLKSLLDPNDPDTSVFQYDTEVFCYTITDRDTLTGFPVLTGNMKGVGFQLNPIPAP